MKKILITDVDNTLFDWFSVWHASFTAMVAKVQEIEPDIDTARLLQEIREVFQKHGTSEYSYVLEECPSLSHLSVDNELKPAIEAYRKARAENLKLYPTVRFTLETLRASGIKIIAYTESKRFYTATRIEALGIEDLIDVLYSPADHVIPDGYRTYPDPAPRLRVEETPAGELKPNAHILKAIISANGGRPEDCVYIGDSKAKDIAMANSAGVTSVLAAYGGAHVGDGKKYELLRKVSHWTSETIEHEKKVASGQISIEPKHTIERFSDLLELMGVAKLDRAKVAELNVSIWKQIVDVQMHFNEIGMKIRNFSILILAALVSAAGLALKENVFVSGLPLASIFFFASVIVCAAFYFMDRFWFYPLLKGAVVQGDLIEKQLEADFPSIALTRSIGEHSPVRLKGLTLHSKHKMAFFYFCLMATFLAIGFLILFAEKPNRDIDSSAPESPIALPEPRLRDAPLEANESPATPATSATPGNSAVELPSEMGAPAAPATEKIESPEPDDAKSSSKS